MADHFRFGSWATSDPSKVVALYGWVYSSGYRSGLFAPTKQPTVAGDAYVVPASKELWFTEMRVMSYNSPASFWLALGYADGQIACDNAALPTGTIVDIWGDASQNATNNINGWGFFHSSSTGNNSQPHASRDAGLWGPIPAGKAPFIAFAGTGSMSVNVSFYGYLKDV